MFSGAHVVDVAEQCKWCDALDLMLQGRRRQGMQLARECQHPDAQWLVSLFPADADVKRKHIVEVMLEQVETRNDPRAMLLVAWLADTDRMDLLLRAAEMGYAPAQGRLATVREGADDADGAFFWATEAAARSDRYGLCRLGSYYKTEYGCTLDEAKGLALYKKAGELGDGEAQYYYGRDAYGEFAWERYHWWSRLASTRWAGHRLWNAMIRLLPCFERGELGRILHIGAPVIREHLNADQLLVFDYKISAQQLGELQCVLELHRAMLVRARRAIDCWSVVGRRCRVVKDMRVTIAKMAWEEAWRWGEGDGTEADWKRMCGSPR
jgi:hypothetical protein